MIAKIKGLWQRLPKPVKTYLFFILVATPIYYASGKNFVIALAVVGLVYGARVSKIVRRIIIGLGAVSVAFIVGLYF